MVPVQLGLSGLGDALTVGRFDGDHLDRLPVVIVVVGGGGEGGINLLKVDGGDVLEEDGRWGLRGHPYMTSTE